jgi:hypothetical protein
MSKRRGQGCDYTCNTHLTTQARTTANDNFYTQTILSRAFGFLNDSYEDHLDFNWDTCACLTAKYCYENHLSSGGRVQGEHPMPLQLTAAFAPHGIICEARGRLYGTPTLGGTWDRHVTLVNSTTNDFITYKWYFKKRGGQIQLHYDGCSKQTATTPVRKRKVRCLQNVHE